ncbi:MAG TPA: 50S ribosomal protein L13 [Candidatus Paceibacterota bacterium]|nr:50S ribosomal protein L13 [Candidatus Paceibacterota bacterium]
MKTRMNKDSKNRIAHNIAPLSYTVDASGKTLGRVATDAAMALLGKKSAEYVPNKVLPVEVTITNASKMKLTEKRVAQKTYVHYTGYPGGLRETSMPMLIEKKGLSEVIRKAVDGMIPRNKLRKERMKRLTITD